MDNLNYCVLGNDERSKNLRLLFITDGKVLTDYTNADVIIGPTPFSKDNITVNSETIKCEDLFSEIKKRNVIFFAGAISKDLKQKLNTENITYVDLMDDTSVAIQNAIPTAEGAIFEAIKNTNFTLHSSNTLILGYGKIGKVLAKMLQGVGANVYCEARKKEDLAFIKAMGYNSISLDVLDNCLKDMDVIFNTIPSMILDEKRLKKLKKTCVIIDLASSPGGVDFNKANSLGITTSWALALPAKVAPLSAARYLKNAVDEYLRR